MKNALNKAHKSRYILYILTFISRKTLMKKILFPAWICLVVIFVSCAAAPKVREAPQETVSQELSPFSAVPERPVRPQVPAYIMGTGLIPPRDMSAFLLSNNPNADRGFVEELAFLYFEEAAIEGVNHDIAFTQMCLETGFLSFGNLVTPDMYNFAGLGSIGPGQHGHSFPDPRTGVRAHVQHLKAYGSDEPLKQELVNPRYRFVRRGSSPTIMGLAGTWAADPNYAEKINNMLERLYNFTYGII